MKISDMFSGSFLKAADLKGKMCKVVIESVDQELLRGDHGEEEKIVVTFKGRDKRLILNKTNATIIASIHGDDTDDWSGKEIKLYSANVQFQGQIVPAVRVFQEPPEGGEEDGDTIPF